MICTFSAMSADRNAPDTKERMHGKFSLAHFGLVDEDVFGYRRVHLRGGGGCRGRAAGCVSHCKRDVSQFHGSVDPLSVSAVSDCFAVGV